MVFDFNIHSSPLLIGFFQGLVFAILLLLRGAREERLSDALLAILLVLSNFHIAHYMLGFGGWYDSHDRHSTFMFYFPFHNFLLIAPIIYFYFRSLSNQNFKFEAKHFWHFAPGIIYYLEYLIVFLVDVVYSHWIQGQVFPLHFGTKGLWADFNQGPIQSVFSTLGLISTYIYLWLTLKEYRLYKTYINDNFSDTGRIEFKWLRNILYLLIIGLTVTWAFTILGSFISFSYQQYWTSHFVLALMIYFVSIFGYSNTVVLPRALDFIPDQTVEEVNTTKASEIPELERWKRKLTILMEDEKSYLNPELTLNDLASKLKTNSSIISKVINTGFEQNFNDFINAYRVGAFEKKLKLAENSHLTLTSLAFDCGFNSKATFNRAFKKFNGMSPREYQHQIGLKS